jgi:hypothetical protein
MNFVSEFLLNGREDFRGLGGVKYSSKPLVFNSPNWGNLEGEWKGVIPLILKKKKLSIMPLLCQFIMGVVPLILGNVVHIVNLYDHSFLLSFPT